MEISTNEIGHWVSEGIPGVWSKKCLQIKVSEKADPMI